jgi:hypothetical protein
VGLGRSVRHGRTVENERVAGWYPGGTITRFVYHAKGWVLGRCVGTDDTGATDTDPSANGASNMRQVAGFIYDNGGAGKDGLLTRQTLYENASVTRVTNYLYSYRCAAPARPASSIREMRGTHTPAWTGSGAVWISAGSKPVTARLANGSSTVTTAPACPRNSGDFQIQIIDLE